MKKPLLFLGLLLCSAMFSLAQTSPADNPNAADFKFETLEYDFGTLNEGESVTYEYNFSNVGEEPLIISQAKGSCGCTVPEWPKEPIKKGGKGVVKVVFNSQGKAGMQRKSITITSNAKTPSVRLIIKGNVLKKEDPTASPAPENKME